MKNKPVIAALEALRHPKSVAPPKIKRRIEFFRNLLKFLEMRAIVRAWRGRYQRAGTAGWRS
jgi:hypothetical protein